MDYLHWDYNRTQCNANEAAYQMGARCRINNHGFASDGKTYSYEVMRRCFEARANAAYNANKMHWHEAVDRTEAFEEFKQGWHDEDDRRWLAQGPFIGAGA